MKMPKHLGKQNGICALALACLCSAQLAAQPRTAWDGVYTEAQAARGMAAFGQSCGGCHTLGTEGRSPLVGDKFWKSFSQKTAADLFDYISKNMPNGSPGSLAKSAYEDIAAQLLKSNGFPAGAAELHAEAVSNVQIIPKDGRTELPANALARVVGCLAKDGSDWVVTQATTPVRAESPSTGDDTRPLGSGSMTLKFVITKLDPMVGSRIAVTGLLMGAGGADGINVTNVARIAAKCP